MGHSHSHGQDAGFKSLAIAFFLNLGFTVFEIAGGLLTNSVAILSDAVHDAGDSITLGIAWLLQRGSAKGSDAKFTYGYKRFSVLGALITGLVLIAGVTFILYQAVQRLNSPEPVSGPGMAVVAVVGMVVNGWAALKLRGGRSLNEKVASWHLLEDVLGWAAVLVGGLVLWKWQIAFIDPLLSILISLFVLWNVGKTMKKVLRVFLQRAPSDFSVAGFESDVCKFPLVRELHHTHVWTLDGEHHVLTTHVVVEPRASREDILRVKERVRELLDSDTFEHVTVDIELAEDPCVSSSPHAG